MTAAAHKTRQSRSRNPSVSSRSKPSKRLSLQQYKLAQRLARDAFKKQCGG